MKTHSGHLVTMKLLQETEDKLDRKFVKSQVERRRRDRMNSSLERLRTMLLQQQQKSAAQSRVEKAEVLERTVLFLHRSAKGDESRGGGGGGGGGRGGERKSFQDGFSSCLQRAALFLGPQGKGLCLTAALDSYFVQRSDSDSPLVRLRPETSCPSSVLRALRQRTQALRPYARRPPVPPASPRVSSQSRRDKQSPAQNGPVDRTLWRPWP